MKFLTSKRDFPHTVLCIFYFELFSSLLYLLLTKKKHKKEPPGESRNCMSFIYSCLHFYVHTLLSCAFVVILYWYHKGNNPIYIHYYVYLIFSLIFIHSTHSIYVFPCRINAMSFSMHSIPVFSMVFSSTLLT